MRNKVFFQIIGGGGEAKGGLDTCTRAKKVTAFDSAETGLHIHVFF